jgi:ribosomal protein S18 acetylase RimI-like enzyme
LEFRVRKAAADDIESLEAVINQHWKVNIDHHQEMTNRDAILLVAEAVGGHSSGNPIVGTGLMWVTNWNKTGYLVELAVGKEHQRKGIGKALVDEFARVAKEKQLRAIIVETQPDNKEGMDFYLTNGFRLCGYNDRYYTNSPKSSHEIALFFSLDLDQ